MRRFRSGSFAPFAAVATLALLLAACGGGGDDDASFAGETVESADGVLTVEVPEGAAPEGVEVTIAVLEDDELPAELRDIEGAIVASYELGPDGTEFAEPVMVTFRLDPRQHGIELADGAVPLALLLTETAAGDLEGITGGEVSRDGDLVVARVALSHFSTATVVVSDERVLELDPPRVELNVGQSASVRVVENNPDTGDSFSDIDEPDWEAVSPFVAGANPANFQTEVSCTAPTDGWITGAYTALVERAIGNLTLQGALAALFKDLNLFDAERAFPRVRLSGDGKCNAQQTSTPSGNSADGGASSSVGLNAANAAGENSGDIAGAAGGCEDAGSAEAECVPHIDITGVRWGPVDGAPNLLEIGVTLGGPPPADLSADYTVTVVGTERGSGTPIVQEQIRALTGEFSCESFRGGEPGETCDAPAPSQFLITVDISELTHPLKIELFSIQGTTEGRVTDHYVIEAIGE